jgi:hypothetical protein
MQYVFVPSEAKFHTDFYQGHFDLLNWNLGSQVKKFNRKAEGNFESCSAVSGQRNLILEKIVFIFDDENFHTGSKNKWDKKLLIFIVLRVILILIFRLTLFQQKFSFFHKFPKKKSLHKKLFHRTRLN